MTGTKKSEQEDEEKVQDVKFLRLENLAGKIEITGKNIIPAHSTIKTKRNSIIGEVRRVTLQLLAMSAPDLARSSTTSS